MSKNPKEFVEIFKCPDCENNLIVDGENMKCEKCERIIPIIDGVAVFLSQKDVKEFYAGLNLEIFTHIDEDRKMLSELTNSDDYIKSLNQIAEYAKSEKRQEAYGDMMNVDDWLSDPVAQKAAYDQVDEMADVAKDNNIKMILDWPTGPGGMIRSLLKTVNNDAIIFSYEISLISIILLKNALAKLGMSNNIVFINGDVRKMPFKNDSFDLVTVWGLLSEIVEPNMALEETYRVLKNNGTLVGAGEVYKEGSESLKIADSQNAGQLATKERVNDLFNKLGLSIKEYKVHFEGYDTDTDDITDEERCPLPARGDWYQNVMIKAKK